MQSDGYWINPEGQILRLSSPSHISQIIGYPEKFGITKQDIGDTFSKHGERYGVEGRAREELILRILKKGFIRVRSYVNYWSVTLNRFGTREKFALQEWAHSAIKNQFSGINSEVNIYVTSTDQQLTFKLKDFLSGHITEGLEKEVGYNPKVVRSIYEYKTYNKLGLIR